ncbi:MAG TPA: hypothetical protein EYP90_05140 [Chromatiaceae bacterium]|nr:hypothetical protein [Chromatiaceae bacterium]
MGSAMAARQTADVTEEKQSAEPDEPADVSTSSEEPVEAVQEPTPQTEPEQPPVSSTVAEETVSEEQHTEEPVEAVQEPAPQTEPEQPPVSATVAPEPTPTDQKSVEPTESVSPPQKSKTTVPDPTPVQPEQTPEPIVDTNSTESADSSQESSEQEESVEDISTTPDVFDDEPSVSTESLSPLAENILTDTVETQTVRPIPQQQSVPMANASDVQSFLIQTIEQLGQAKKELAQVNIELEIERLKNQARKFF